MAIANPVRLPRQEIREQAAEAQDQALHSGTGVNQAFVPNQRADNNDGGGSNGGGQGSQHSDANAQAYNGISTGIHGATAQQAPAVERPWLAGDSVLNNIGPYAVSTFQAGSMQRNTWQKQYASTQGKNIRLAGDMPNEWKGQINGEVLQARVQHRPMNRDFVVNRYALPIRA